MRGWVVWVVILAGFVVLIGIVAAVGGDDDTEETVTALEWADGVCGSVAVWRGEMEPIVDGVRAAGESITFAGESGAVSPQGRTGSVRTGLERAIIATETMVEGVERSGTPDTAQGDEAADRIAAWSDETLGDLEDAEEDLGEGAETVEELTEQIAAAAQAIGGALTSGVQTIADVALLDPDLASALRESETCRQFEEETS
jgi:hypothetical protein